MVIFITGGSGSGKSEYAENRAMELKSSRQADNLVYIAAMEPLDEESRKRVERHRRMRKDKNFATRECYTHLEELGTGPGEILLLECLSNLTANEMFSPSGRKKQAASVIKEGICHLIENSRDLIVVGNNVFEDGVEYDGTTREYLEQMAELHRFLAERSDEVIEVVYGLPVYWKGDPHEIS